MARRSWRSTLSRWHRRVGIVSAVFVVLLATTGVALNHSDRLRLAQLEIHWPALLTWYGIEPAAITSFAVGDRWLSEGGGTLFLQDRPILDCPPPLRGAVAWRDQLLALCDDRLMWMTEQGDLMETLTAVHGLPEQPQGLAVVDGHPVVGGVQGAAWDLVDWTSRTLEQPLTRVRPEPAPTAIQARLQAHWQGMTGVTLERVLLDLHSGRLLGRWGPWLMDAAALLLLILALSGLWLWRRRRH